MKKIFISFYKLLSDIVWRVPVWFFKKLRFWLRRKVISLFTTGGKHAYLSSNEYFYRLPYAYSITLVGMLLLYKTIVKINHALTGNQDKFIDNFVMALSFMLIILTFVIFATLTITLVKRLKSGIYKNFSKFLPDVLFVISVTSLFYSIIFTIAYYNIPNSFNIPKTINVEDTLNVFISMFYFSIATISTTGFGDITPANTFAQIVVTLEMLLSICLFIILFSNFSNINSKKKQDRK